MTQRWQHKDWRFPGIVLISLALVACQSAPPQLPAKAQVSVIASSDTAGERKLVQALKAELGPNTAVYSVQSRSNQRKLRRDISRKPGTLVISIGPEASKFAARLKPASLVFCRVLDYRSAGLGQPYSRGVSVLPDPARVIGAWKSFSPASTTLGVITGTGLQSTINDLAKAAKASNVKLVHRVAGSDKEFLYLSGKMAKEVDAYWLLPDSRVLSAVTIRRFMENSIKQGKHVIAYTPTLLKLGALMSAEPDTEATARLLKQTLVSDFYKANDKTPEISYVSAASIQINVVGAERFGLKIPKSLQRNRYE